MQAAAPARTTTEKGRRNGNREKQLWSVALFSGENPVRQTTQQTTSSTSPASLPFSFSQWFRRVSGKQRTSTSNSEESELRRSLWKLKMIKRWISNRSVRVHFSLIIFDYLANYYSHLQCDFDMKVLCILMNVQIMLVLNLNYQILWSLFMFILLSWI